MNSLFRLQLVSLLLFFSTINHAVAKDITRFNGSMLFTDSTSVSSERENSTNRELSVYQATGLAKAGLSEAVFHMALKGYNYLVKHHQVNRKSIISIIDYSKPSNEKRLYVIDLLNGKLLFNCLVAHGRNSGLDIANSFSNDADSYKSSLGFYVTEKTYSGECGYALQLKGLERGINDKARERNIVMHGSEYVNEAFIRENGYLGRSLGCPAIPEKIHRKVIDAIKNGTCLFVYHPTKKYLKSSHFLKG